MNISLRIVQPSEAAEVAALGRETFYEKWGAGYSEADMSAYLAEAFALELIQEELNNPLITYIVADVDGVPVGYGKLVRNKKALLFGDEPLIELERLYVFEKFHATGLAQQLMHRLLKIAQDEKWTWIILGVDVNNHRAIRFYTKYGFETFDKKIFRVGKVEDTDQLMKLKLN
jgi:ribosomal protein S18 acetylase RimI-like enzyme